MGLHPYLHPFWVVQYNVALQNPSSLAAEPQKTHYYLLKQKETTGPPWISSQRPCVESDRRQGLLQTRDRSGPLLVSGAVPEISGSYLGSLCEVFWMPCEFLHVRFIQP